MSKGVTLSQALNTRLCHDLAGVIGTVDNCISLIDNDNKSIGQKAKILAELESKNLINKIKFFRCAYGISDKEKEISLVFLSKLLKDFFCNSGINLQFKFEEGIIFLESEIIKATMSLISVARDLISAGEVILYIGSKDGKRNINVRANANGKILKLKDDNLAILRGEKKKSSKANKINFYNCREHYITNIYKQCNYRMLIDSTNNHIEYDVIKL
jgi:histidine phosphotransferase ChpT